jgi:Zn-finger nucleic acid-binding protein
MTKLKCPKCPILHLEVRSIGAIAVDCCANCGGVWVESGQLDSVLQLCAEDLAALPESRRDNSLDDMKTGKCPRDKERLEHQLFKEGWRVVVDRCAKCQGTWFDGGELEKVHEP